MRNYITILLSTFLTSCLTESELPLAADFRAEVKNENLTAPVTVSLNNLSYGADTYMWTFEGGKPSSSTDKNPSDVVFSTAGKHKITLTAVNTVGQNTKDTTITVYPAVSIGFSYNVQINNIAPAVVEIVNTTKGATGYEWHFEGGEPETSTNPNPGCITFSEGGKHEILLRVTNGLDYFEHRDTVELRSPLKADFNITPLGVDEDMEAPVTLQLTNTSVSALNSKWSAPGGTLSSDTASVATVRYSKPGTYNITLTANDNKNSQTVSRSITVKENTGILVANNLHFGISEAINTIGCCYSMEKNRVLTSNAIKNASIGETVDIAFFALNSNFNYCYFLSPTEAAKSAIPAIPGATYTMVNNNPAGLKQSDFDNIKKAADLNSLSGWSGTKSAFFTNASCPHIVLFKTADGRRGIINVKSYVKNGSASYIVADIKIEKGSND